MTTVLDIEHRLNDEIVISDQHVGDICCRKLTITRNGSVKGNIVCKHLQLGGYVEGIAVCHALEGNTQGTLHGILYYVTKNDQARVAGFVDYREPPASVWSVMLPVPVAEEAAIANDLDVVTQEVFEEAVAEFVQPTKLDIASDVPTLSTEFGAFDDEEDGNADLEIAGDEIEFASVTSVSALPVEAQSSSTKFFPTPEKAVDALAGAPAAKQEVVWVSTGRKVALDARFF